MTYASVGLDGRARAGEQLLGLAKLRDRRLGLRVDLNHVAPGVGDAEQGHVDLEPHHCFDKRQILLERGFIHFQAVQYQLLFEIRP